VVEPSSGDVGRAISAREIVDLVVDHREVDEYGGRNRATCAGRHQHADHCRRPPMPQQKRRLLPDCPTQPSWGQFDDGLRGFAEMFWRTPPDVPLADAIREALVDFNHLDDVAVAQHRQRMRLLLGTPALLAHSELRYAAWRAVVADFVARRLGLPADDLLPRLAERVALSVALTAYEQWLAAEERSLPELLRNASAGLTSLFVPTAATL
jgi:hypothetical protein